MNKIQMVLLPFLLASTGVFALQRKLTMRVNPDCDDKCQGIPGSLIHVAAVGPNDTVHHVWDFFGKPTVFIALTSSDANLTINWDGLLEEKGKSLGFTETPEYIFSYVIDKLIEFDDVNDTIKYTPSVTDRAVGSEYLNWTLVNKTGTNDEAEAVLKGTFPSNNETPGYVFVKLSAYGIQQHSNVTPHLHHSVNATEVEFVLDHLPTTFNHSRYAVHFGVFYTNEDPELKQITYKTLDDEHAPGVFDVSEMLTTTKETYRGYMQWRDVAYTSAALAPARLESTQVHYSPAETVDFNLTSYKKSAVYAYFGGHLEDTSARQFSVSFGQQDDQYYTKTPYLKWTFLSGIGKPVEDSFSLMVWLILGIGFGLSALLIILSIGCIISRRVSTTRDSLLAF